MGNESAWSFGERVTGDNYSNYDNQQAQKTQTDCGMLVQRLKHLSQQRHDVDQDVSKVVAQLVAHYNHQQEQHQIQYNHVQQELMQEHARAETAQQMATELRATISQYEKRLAAHESSMVELARVRDLLSAARQEANGAAQQATHARKSEAEAQQRARNLEAELSQAHSDQSAALEQVSQLQQELDMWKEMYMQSQNRGLAHMQGSGPALMPGGGLSHGGPPHMQPGGPGLYGHIMPPGMGGDGVVGQDGSHHMGLPPPPGMHPMPMPHAMPPGGMMPPGMWMHGRPWGAPWAPPAGLVHTPLPPPLQHPPAPVSNPAPQPSFVAPQHPEPTPSPPAEQGPPAQTEPPRQQPGPQQVAAALAANAIRGAQRQSASGNSNGQRTGSSGDLSVPHKGSASDLTATQTNTAPVIARTSQPASAPLTSHPSHSSSTPLTSHPSHTSTTPADITDISVGAFPLEGSGLHLLGLLGNKAGGQEGQGMPPRPLSNSDGSLLASAPAPGPNRPPSTSGSAPGSNAAPGSQQAGAGGNGKGGKHAGRGRSGGRAKRTSGNGSGRATGSDASGDVAVLSTVQTDQNAVRPAPGPAQPTAQRGPKTAPVQKAKEGGQGGDGPDARNKRPDTSEGRPWYSKPGGNKSAQSGNK